MLIGIARQFIATQPFVNKGRMFGFVQNQLILLTGG